MAIANYRVLILETDETTSNDLKDALKRESISDVVRLDTCENSVAIEKYITPDMIVISGSGDDHPTLECLETLRSSNPNIPIIMVTDESDSTFYRTAVRHGANDFVASADIHTDLGPTASRLLSSMGNGERKAQRKKNRVLAVGAHPDDVEIGIGGILCAHAEFGDDITILTMTHGGRGGQEHERIAEAGSVSERLGAKLHIKDLEDTNVSAGGSTVRIIEEVIRECNPDIVYTHSIRDSHQDHRAVHEAVNVAARRINTLANFQSPSSTVSFRPNRFVPIGPFLDRKLEIIGLYGSQKHRAYMEPENVRATARYWSRFSSGIAVEPLEIIHES